MVDSTPLDRLTDSPTALVAGTLVVALLGVLVNRIGLPPQRALVPAGIAVFVLLMVGYDWFYRR
jgi:hypothetical protein